MGMGIMSRKFNISTSVYSFFTGMRLYVRTRDGTSMDGMKAIFPDQRTVLCENGLGIISEFLSRNPHQQSDTGCALNICVKNAQNDVVVDESEHPLPKECTTPTMTNGGTEVTVSDYHSSLFWC